MRSTPSSTSSRFLSTPSARRATACENHRTRPECYFYPRPPRGGRRAALRLLHPRRPISIHALREEGDRSYTRRGDFSMEFLSTPSARRATQCGQLRHQLLQDFYPRPPRGGRRLAKIIGHALNAISIHALREEGDGLLYDYYTLADLFLSTPSARRAT